MRLLVTTHSRLYKGPDGLYYAPLVYDYDFFKRYLCVFEEIRIVAHVEDVSIEKAKTMLLVSGPHLEVFELPFPHGKWNYIKAVLAIQRRIASCYFGCDAALFRIPDIMAFQVFSTIRRKHIPIAVEVVADPLLLYGSQGGRYPFRLFLKWFEYWSQKKCCQKASCVSYVTNEYLQRVYPSKITPKSNRFESHYTSAGIDQHEKIDRDYLNKKTIRLLHVSTSISGRNKGHKELVEAFIGLRKTGYDVNLVLVGGDDLDVEIRELLAKSGESERVIFTGLLDKKQLSTEYKNADIFVFPSYREGLPRVIIEAMSWGLPCVATNIPGCKELLNESMLATVGDTESLIKILVHLLDNPKIMREESERNIQESMNYYSDVVDVIRTEFYNKLRTIASK